MVGVVGSVFSVVVCCGAGWPSASAARRRSGPVIAVSCLSAVLGCGQDGDENLAPGGLADNHLPKAPPGASAGGPEDGSGLRVVTERACGAGRAGSGLREGQPGLAGGGMRAMMMFSVPQMA